MTQTIPIDLVPRVSCGDLTRILGPLRGMPR
jgi:hypothetical protein